MRTRLAATVGALASVLLLAACSSGSSTAPSSAAAPSAPAASATAAPASGAPSPELTAWAGQVCDETAALRESVDGVAAAVASGGTDIAASLSGQAATIATAAATLVTTVQAIPADGSSPEATAVKDSAAQTSAAVDALGQSITDLTNASGIGAIAALAGVASAATDAVSAVGSTVETISAAIGSGGGTLGEAFAANPQCAALQQ